MEVRFLRTTTEEGQQAIDSLASAFRHVEDIDYEMNFRDGGKLKGEDLKIFSNVSVRLLSNGLVDEGELYKQMHDYLINILTDQLEPK